jgi:hypothetical protein
MDKKSSGLAEKVWKEMKKKHVDDWEPSQADVEWLTKTVAKLEVGGKWVIPDAGVTFEKVGADHLRLKSIATEDLLNAILAIEKTRKVGEKAGIRVGIESAADYVLFRL